jgi:hypothetical protein
VDPLSGGPLSIRETCCSKALNNDVLPVLGT